ncbi:lysosome-associated membrane glycoprotein 2 [Lampris incognitus]|uniref:lysosome-associated membrane glycoprotein 2 n=1 Tax=Lampris incognitus TaxID=2546036 RepID=UPI0024B548FF|nr:lysosome-associated membrane glycoprotein 2 [Lampris incognitus]
MIAEDPRCRWFLPFLATILLGINPPGDCNSILAATDFTQDTDGHIYRPALQPSEAVPVTGTYTLKTAAGKPCLIATMGIEYIVIAKKKPWYFSLDPARVSTNGFCVRDAAFLSLSLANNTGNMTLIFKKEGNVTFATQMTAHISPLPVCDTCASKSYLGTLANDRLFSAPYGWRFNCNSGSVFVMSKELRIKLVPLRIQAFTGPTGQFGKQVECWADFNRNVIPIIVEATVIGLLLIAVLTFLIIKDRRRPGYDPL